jgi:hypothetical protein
MMTTLLAAALAVANVTRAAAADIVALTGHVTQLGAHCSALVYYIVAPDGFPVVVTTQQGSTNQAAIARFEPYWQRDSLPRSPFPAIRARRRYG